MINSSFRNFDMNWKLEQSTPISNIVISKFQLFKIFVISVFQLLNLSDSFIDLPFSLKKKKKKLFLYLNMTRTENSVLHCQIKKKQNKKQRRFYKPLKCKVNYQQNDFS